MTQDALIIVNDDELITSETTNGNNLYLEGLVSSSAEGTKTYTDQQIAIAKGDLEGQLTTAQTNLQNSINALNSVLANSGLFITQYATGQAWYREYFSDSAKTNRVWCEQGGVRTYSAAQYQTIGTVFPLAYSSAPYVVAILRSPGSSDDSNQGVTDVDRYGFQFIHRGWGEGLYWYACGI